MLPDTMRHKHIEVSKNIKQNDANMDQSFSTPISMPLVKSH